LIPRPSPPSPDTTRARILAAALREFTDKGVRGGRVDAIARAAEANKQLIYYYFGSKASLFREVVRRHLDEHYPGASQPGSTVTRRLLVQDRTYADDPDFLRLLTWEALEEVTEVAELRRAGVQAYLEQIRADQASGLLAEVDAGQLLLAEIGIAIIPHLFPQLAQLATGRAATDPRARTARAQFLAWLGGRLDQGDAAPLNGSRAAAGHRASRR
jgi:AcrR family transcriptional regulator